MPLFCFLTDQLTFLSRFHEPMIANLLKAPSAFGWKPADGISKLGLTVGGGPAVKSVKVGANVLFWLQR